MNQFTKTITIIGDETAAGGAYWLRLRLVEKVDVVFGRFRDGRPQPLPPGAYLYIGSAMRGLGRRVVRHAGRSGEKPPHPIRRELCVQLPAAGLGKGDLRPRRGKKLHWHVDYLLEETAVTLTHVLILRSHTRQEADLARRLAAHPDTAVPLPGLGARDVPGNTHLLAIPEPLSWWRTLIDNMMRDA